MTHDKRDQRDFGLRIQTALEFSCDGIGVGLVQWELLAHAKREHDEQA